MIKFKFIDLFSGIGGFHIGMHKNGGECVFASEIDKFARLTYKENFREIAPNIFDYGYFNNDISDPAFDYDTIPDFDVLCAGFPCQPFSQAGLKKGFDDTRGTLFFNVQEIIRAKVHGQVTKNSIPKVLLLENVKGLRNHDGGKTLGTIVSVLDDLGYEVESKVLNSKNFGVPQNRERIFIVGWHRDSIATTGFEFPMGLDSDGRAIFDEDELGEKTIAVKLGQILLSCDELQKLEEKEGRSYTISERLWAGHKRRRESHKRKGNGFGYSLFNRESAYTSTISARYYKDGSEILVEQRECIDRPNRPRKLHPKEAARLQGFPRGFRIPVSNAQAYKQFGNSVSVPVIETLAKEITIQLLKNDVNRLQTNSKGA